MTSPQPVASATLPAREREVVRALGAARVLPVVTVDDASHAEGVARALVRGGLSCMEIAFRTSAAAEAIRRARRVDGLLVGAGTVLSPEQAEAAAEAGAHFAVAPGTNDEVVRTCRDMELPFIPGVATPTEIEHTRELGLTVLKVFPIATCGGTDFLRAVSATYPDVRFVPTGGIGPDSLADYLAIPSVLACGGSWLVGEPGPGADGLDEVEQLAREAVELASAVRRPGDA